MLPLRTLVPFGLLAASAASQCLCFHNNPPGTNLLLGDDGLRVVSLPFAFPFAGATYTRITIDSNGVVRLGDSALTNPSDPSPTTNELRNDPHPSIALLWDDWAVHQCAAGDGIFYEADTSRASIVFKNVPQKGTGPGLLSGEVVLMPDGTIYLDYQPTCTLPSIGQCIAGLSRGSGAPTNSFDPVSSVSIADSTGYHVFDAASKQLELSGWTFQVAPTGPGSYSLAKAFPPACAPAVMDPGIAQGPFPIGVGCPRPVANGSIYEVFSGNSGARPFDLANTSLEFVQNNGSYTLQQGPGFDAGYQTNGFVIPGVDDDSQHAMPLGAMGSFRFGTMQATATVTVGANGYVWLPTGSAAYNAVATAFHSQGARIAAAWTDLIPNAMTAPIYWENHDPSFCRATWVAVPAFGDAGANTFQVTLKSNGNIVLSYAACTMGDQRPPLVGISGGNGAANLGISDLAVAGMAQPITRRVTGIAAMSHTASRIQLGTNLQLNATLPDETSFFGLFVFGLTSPGIALDSYGMTDCVQHSTYELSYFPVFFPPGQPMNLTLPVAYDIAYGVDMFSQAAAWSTLNPFGVIVSNGLRHHVGL